MKSLMCKELKARITTPDTGVVTCVLSLWVGYMWSRLLEVYTRT